jgi:hypothetical protein
MDPKLYVPDEVVLQKCMGCFTNDPHVIEMHQCAGIPVWTARKSSTFSVEIILRTEVVYLHDDYEYGVETRMSDPPPAAIFTGNADDDAKFSAIIAHCQRLFLMETGLSHTASSVASRTAPPSSSTSRALTVARGRSAPAIRPSPIGQGRNTGRRGKSSFT